ncbi:YpbS family protein [Paenibacillus allorhizosphaerae]|uniref:DUF2533 family protein n=1 Tax=Paenibacillus allorhizosphaerae TaxID=2849866 RepID=A0ABM8VE91_9BACL|nr:hypothetical protein PAECIP111802_01418 [Paenibacillus allorhizosphaerae]
MSVHEAITAHTRKQHSHLEQFLELEEAREHAIDHAVARCAAGQPFHVDAINEWTIRINKHAQNGISPTRALVTEQMVRDFVPAPRNKTAANDKDCRMHLGNLAVYGR